MLSMNDKWLSKKKLMNIEKEHHCHVVPFFIFSDGYKASNTGGHQSRLSSWGGWFGLALDGPNKRKCNSARMIALGPGDVAHDEALASIFDSLREELLGKTHIMHHGVLGQSI